MFPIYHLLVFSSILGSFSFIRGDGIFCFLVSIYLHIFIPPPFIDCLHFLPSFYSLLISITARSSLLLLCSLILPPLLPLPSISPLLSSPLPSHHFITSNPLLSPFPQLLLLLLLLPYTLTSLLFSLNLCSSFSLSSSSVYFSTKLSYQYLVVCSCY